MTTRAKLIEKILSGQTDNTIRFDELRGLLKQMGFTERTRGSHHIFTKPEVPERINLQNTGGTAKPYQVKQIRRIIVEYGLGRQ